MIPDSYRTRFELHARLATFARRVSLARERVAEWLSLCERPYVSFSTGKDSVCVLALVREVAPKTPAVYWDAECGFPETYELLERTPDCRKFATDEPMLETLRRCGLRGGEVETETMRTTVWNPVRRFLKESGCDGAAYGLRAEESRGRRMNALARGGVFYAKQYGVWMCQPVWDWSYADVWAFIVTRGLDYCKTYDQMWDMPEREQRISYWAGETNREWGRFAWLKRNYPQLWNRLVEAVPEASTYV